MEFPILPNFNEAVPKKLPKLHVSVSVNERLWKRVFLKLWCHISACVPPILSGSSHNPWLRVIETLPSRAHVRSTRHIRDLPTWAAPDSSGLHSLIRTQRMLPESGPTGPWRRCSGGCRTYQQLPIKVLWTPCCSSGYIVDYHLYGRYHPPIGDPGRCVSHYLQ